MTSARTSLDTIRKRLIEWGGVFSVGPTYPRGSRGSLREIVFRSYRIFYDVAESSRSVEILHVWHGAREEPTF